MCQTAWHFSSGVSFDTPVYPRLTWLGSIGRAHGDATLKRLQNWHSKTRFQVFMCSRSNWGLEVVLLKTRRAKQEHQEKTTLSKEETNKKADPTRRRHWHLNPDHNGGGRVLCSPTPYPLPPPLTFPLPLKRHLHRLTISPQSPHSPY